MINIEYVWTKDNLRLQGIHYKGTKDTCVIFVHGMTGNFIENYQAYVVGKTLSENGFGFLYGHNRGYNHVNDIATKDINQDGGYKLKRIGTVYERFEKCGLDIDVWINKCNELGYKHIVLMGHSLGCNKVIYYLHNNKVINIVGVILASPSDMVGLVKKPEYQPNYEALLNEAKNNVENGNPTKILSAKIWDYHDLSSQTFLDFFVDNCPADNLPVMRNPKEFTELSSIDVPILGIMGENDDIGIKSLKEDLELIVSKAKKCPSFTKCFIKGANHTYDRQEKYLAEAILNWIKQINKE